VRTKIADKMIAKFLIFKPTRSKLKFYSFASE